MRYGLISTDKHIFQTLSIKIVCGLCVFTLLLTGCTAEKTPKASVLTEKQYVNWIKTSTQQFIASSQQTIDVTQLDTNLKQWLVTQTPPTKIGTQQTTNTPVFNSVVLAPIPQQSSVALHDLQKELREQITLLELTHPAQLTLARQSLDMLNTYLFSLLGQHAIAFTDLGLHELSLRTDAGVLNPGKTDNVNLLDQQLMQGLITDRNKLNTELQALHATFAVLHEGGIEVYHSDQASQTFAFSRTSPSNRAYIVFNFSYETQPVPMPLGFMASTKVTLWQSDTTGTRQFVTNQPIQMRPFTATIVIVG